MSELHGCRFSSGLSAVLIRDSGMKLAGEHRPQGVDNIQSSLSVRQS